MFDDEEEKKDMGSSGEVEDYEEDLPKTMRSLGLLELSIERGKCSKALFTRDGLEEERDQQVPRSERRR
jgi:hypothetical protein